MRNQLLSLIVVTLISTPSFAQENTQEFLGCFVQENNTCADVDIQCSEDSYTNYLAFDVAVGGLCDRITAFELKSEGYEQKQKDLTTKLQNSKRRVTRLKRKCGAKCAGL